MVAQWSMLHSNNRTPVLPSTVSSYSWGQTCKSELPIRTQVPSYQVRVLRIGLTPVNQSCQLSRETSANHVIKSPQVEYCVNSYTTDAPLRDIHFCRDLSRKGLKGAKMTSIHSIILYGIIVADRRIYNIHFEINQCSKLQYPLQTAAGSLKGEGLLDRCVCLRKDFQTKHFASRPVGWPNRVTCTYTFAKYTLTILKPWMRWHFGPIWAGEQTEALKGGALELE